MSSDHRSAGRRAALTGIGVAVVLGLYVLVLVLFGNSTRLETASGPGATEPPPGGLAVIVELTGVSPVEGTATANIAVAPSLDLLDDQGQTKEPIELQLFTAFPENDTSNSAEVSGGQERRVDLAVTTVEFPAGSPGFGLSQQATFRVDGNYQDYPFDTWASDVFVSAAQTGTLAARERTIPANLAIIGDVAGWLIRDRDLLDAEEMRESGGARAAGELVLVRAGSTKTFVILLAAAMLVLAACALLVARAVVTRRRRIEATMASWFAAMLFAVIPLRLNMPGAPPIGVWLDFLVLLWVELALMIGLAVFIGSWLRFSAAPDDATGPANRPDRAVAGPQSH